MTWTRGTTNSNARGSARDRRRRRAWMIETFGIPRLRDGKKTLIKCHHCPRVMRAQYRQWEVDRWPLCGHDNGRYVRGNVVPSCRNCNKGLGPRACAGCRGARA